MSGSPGLFAAAILGPPLLRLVPSIFSPEFELSTMETCCQRLFIDISVPDGHLCPTLVLQVVTDTKYKLGSSLHEHAKGRGWLS